jgi:S1-C subfamily serine protease
MLDDKDLFDQDGQHNEQPSAQPAEPAYEAQPAAAEQPAAHDPVMELPEIPVTAAAAEPVMYAPQEAPKKKNSGWKLFAAAVALVAMGGAVGGATTWTLASKLAKNQVPIGLNLAASNGVKAVALTTSEVGASVIPNIYQRVAPATVRIDTTIKQQSRGFFGGGASGGTGTGFVVDASGYIVTNYHVIDGATSITVKFYDGTTLDGKVVSGDQRKDVAVVKVDPGNRSLVTVPLGDSSKVEPGELAIAIGTPFGEEWTVTAGIVSAINRTVQEENSIPIPGAIQTDAAINPGNSGGPLLNGNGEVVGINTLINTGTSGVDANVGIGYAIPINMVKEILPTLMAGKQVEYAFLGVATEDLTPQNARTLGVDVKQGAIVDEVTKGSPAEKAGLQNPVQIGRAVTADVITAIDGKKITGQNDILAYIAQKKPGDEVTLTVVRGKETVELKATLAKRSDFSDN